VFIILPVNYSRRTLKTTGGGDQKIYFSIHEGNTGLDYSILRAVLSQYNASSISFVEKSSTEKNTHVAFIYYVHDLKMNKLNDLLLIKQRSSIKNVLDGSTAFVDKTKLYYTIKKFIPLGIQYLPQTYSIKEFEALNYFSKRNNTPLIIKKGFSSQQKGVKIITNKEEYIKAKKELQIQSMYGLVSEYVTNPITVDGKKFHLRVYFLLSVISGITRCVAHKEYKILTAKNKYIAGDWLNPDIHISGGHSTEKRYAFPDDVDWGLDGCDKDTTIKNLNSCIDTFCLAFSMTNVKNYPENDAGYYLYGADILLKTDNNICFIEINNKPAFFRIGEKEGWEEYNKKYCTNFFTFILTNTILPYLGVCRWPITKAEFIGNGVLSPFGNILTGANRCSLVIYYDDKPSEIEDAKKINFYNMISFEHLMAECSHNNLYVICYGHTIIGFVGLLDDKYIKIAIMEEYKNR